MPSVKNGCLITVLASFVSACSSNSDPSIDASSMSWSECESPSNLECSEISVPMNYADPDGDNITVSMVRVPASGPERKGAILVNPGGPGGSGIELIEAFNEFALENVPESIRSTYDIVGFDPRGVGASTAVDCSALGADDIDDYPTSEESVRDMVADIVAFNTACVEKHGAYLQQLGSLNVVRDMEEIRKAMGDDKLNFIGYSYGSRLGALYLQKYPDTSGRLILDGSMSPDSSITQLMRDQTPAVHANLRSVFAECRLADESCDADKLLSKAAAQLSQLASSEDAEDEFELFGFFLIEAAEDPEFGEFVAETLIQYVVTLDKTVLEDFYTVLIQLTDDYEDDGEDEDNTAVEVAVLCADDAARPSADSIINLLAELNQASDIAAEAMLSQAAMCAGWPAALEPLPLIASDTAPVSLVIGGTTDAQTPLAWSVAMAQSIGGVFVRSEHLGHTSVFNEESDCVDLIAEQFLLDGLVPSNTECGE